MFEAYVLRIFRTGGYTFELKDLQTQKITRLKIPRSPKVNHFQTITSVKVKAEKLWIPKTRNYACVDLLEPPGDLFQVTVSKTHPIKGPPFSKLIQSLIQAQGWISAPKDARLIFVVPSHVYDAFEVQNYLTSEGNQYKNKIPADILAVKQYVLKIDLGSAVASNSPGLQVRAKMR